MKRRRNNNNLNLQISNKYVKIVIFYVLPYILINALLFFLFIQTPKINVVGKDSAEYEDNKIKFDISSIIPIVDVKTYFEENEVPYSKMGKYYYIEANNSGTYKILTSALNGAIINQHVLIESTDDVPPTIDVDSVVIAGGIISISVFDDSSGVNYEKIYMTKDDGSKVSPHSIDSDIGLVHFELGDASKVTIHVEDNIGNSTESTYNLN